MSRSQLIGMLLLAGGLVACGSDATGPGADEPYVGAWYYADSTGRVDLDIEDGGSCDFSVTTNDDSVYLTVTDCSWTAESATHITFVMSGTASDGTNVVDFQDNTTNGDYVPESDLFNYLQLVLRRE